MSFPMLSRLCPMFLLPATITLAACSAPPGDDPLAGATSEAVTSSIGTNVSVTSLYSSTNWRTQSETSISVNYVNVNNKVTTVAYNDESYMDGLVDYPSGGRTIRRGASLMGFAYSSNDGQTWTYGGHVPAPTAWPVLWGDPAITNSLRAQQFVFMSNLAIPEYKFARAAWADGALHGGMDASTMGGACIARSVDAGRTFVMYQCVTNNFAFYDGASMASSPDGHIYAAFHNEDAFAIDIFAANGESSAFVQLPNPFPGMRVDSHPRIRVDNWNSLYAGVVYNGALYLARWNGSQWTAPRLAGGPVVGDNTGNAAVALSDRFVRTAAQFSFDIGPNYYNSDEIRVLYTSTTGSRHFIKGSYCLPDMTGCWDASGWTTLGNVGDQFNPNVIAWRGFIGLPPKWMGTFYSRNEDPTGRTLSVQRADFANLPWTYFFMHELVRSQTPCPDYRGYWGDYDDLQVIGFAGSSPRFIRTFSDSSYGCFSRDTFTSDTLHVSSVVFQ